ncbi:hypothetical protein BHE18_15965 [Rossellomorea aquimaris]|uniref:Uncharacterized protein n=1 Tax=Rossellomorea aquimaris TaxID=189382 RepID=A0A1J6VPF7_9BACI|nr:hypothetical protein BHE18_15965 [Rossellomorea aquimaris]
MEVLLSIIQDLLSKTKVLLSKTDNLLSIPLRLFFINGAISSIPAIYYLTQRDIIKFKKSAATMDYVLAPPCTPARSD